MKVAAVSLLSATHAIPARRAAAPSEDRYDDRRQPDRRKERSPRDRGLEPVRMTPVNRMITGLAVQIIAQIDKPAQTDVAAARAAYRNKTSAAGEVVNYQA
jgi:hypothetical protein